MSTAYSALEDAFSESELNEDVETSNYYFNSDNNDEYLALDEFKDSDEKTNDFKKTLQIPHVKEYEYSVFYSICYANCFSKLKKKEKCNDKKELKNDIDDEFFSLLNSNKLNLKLDFEKQCFFY